MKRNEGLKGFTIVELLIVIVVIGVLAAIVIVAFSGIQERARMSGAMSYASQVKRSPEAANTTASLNFDECSGTTASDSSGGNNHGTIVGTATWSSDTPSGSGCSLSFDGTSTRVTTAATIGANYYLKGAWVKITNCSASNNIISGTGSAFYSCLLRAGHNGDWSAVNGGVNLNDNKWHYVALEYDAGILKMFVDGRRVASVSGQAAPTPLTNTIGALNTGNYFAGLIDDVTIIGR